MSLVPLSTSLPRSQEIFSKISLKKGLGAYFFFGYLMFMAGGLALIVGILNIIYTHNWQVGLYQAVIGTGLFIVLGLLNYLPAHRRLERRKKAFQYGKLTEGVIVGQRRIFVAWKSGRDWEIQVEVEEEGKKIIGALQTSNSELASQLKTGSHVQALCVPGQEILFFPLEIGLQLTPEK